MTNADKILSLNKNQLAHFLLKTTSTYDAECLYLDISCTAKDKKNINCASCIRNWLDKDYNQKIAKSQEVADNLPNELTWALHKAMNGVEEDNNGRQHI